MMGFRGSRAPLWLSLLLCSAATFWIADGVAPWSGDPGNVWHHYEYLTEGFLSGHTYLSVEPRPELLALKDPYDPAANARYRLWDASLYHGKYYLYYGPAPAVMLMVPWRIVTGHMLPQRMAVALFAVAGLAAIALLLCGMSRRHFPGLSGIALGGILIAAFHAAWLPVILRRPGVWELPIVSATACLWWALYFLWRFRDSGGGARWAVATGTALAFMIGCRVTNLFEAAAVLLLLLAPFAGAGTGRAIRWRAACAAAAIVAAGGIALLCYNLERFGNWHEFGQSTMLGGRDIRSSAFLNPSYVPFNMWTYLLSVPEIGPYFPFLHATWPERFPPGYLGYEALYGALFAIPVQLVGLVALAWAWRNRGNAAANAAVLTIAAAAASTAFAGAILFCWQGACSRYITEMFAGWTVAASLGLMVVFGSEGTQRAGRWARILTACAACWTIACTWLASAEFRGFMRQTNPGTYTVLAHTLDYPSQWWIRARGIHFGPVDLDVRIPAGSALGETVLAASGYPEKVNQLVLERRDPGHVRLILNGNEDSVLETPAFATPYETVKVHLSAPWLYPPREHPYWDRYSDLAQRRELQTLFSIDAGAGMISTHSTHSFDASGFEPAVQGAPDGNSQSPYVASLRGTVGIP